MDSLYQLLLNYQKNGYYPMHMPGHKRNLGLMSMENPYGIDITEIDGFDNLHDAQNVLKEAMGRAAKLYQSNSTYYLINGSTCGILSAVAACTKKGDRVLMARNCHKSVYHAIYLNELKPIYLYPALEKSFGISGGISTEDVRRMLCANPDAKLLVITSPTYEGIISDIAAIAKLAHEFKIPLLVDEAHGAHLGFSADFPKNSVQAGADLVIHSLHKTLPAFTQTALLHVNGTLVNQEEIKKYLSIYQSSSPSYLLMAGIDRCIGLLETQGDRLFAQYQRRLQKFSIQMKALKKLRIFAYGNDQKDTHRGACGIYDFDHSKLIISSKNTSISGNELSKKLLSLYKIQVEMVSNDYIIAMTSICDSDEGFERLFNALIKIDQKIQLQKDKNSILLHSNKERKLEAEIAMTQNEAEYCDGQLIPLKQSVGRISKEYVYAYPPGIPLIVPGEVISDAFLLTLSEAHQKKIILKSSHNQIETEIEVVKLP